MTRDEALKAIATKEENGAYGARASWYAMLGALNEAYEAGERVMLERVAQALPQLDREHGGHLAEAVRALAAEGGRE